MGNNSSVSKASVAKRQTTAGTCASSCVVQELRGLQSAVGANPDVSKAGSCWRLQGTSAHALPVPASAGPVLQGWGGLFLASV